MKQKETLVEFMKQNEKLRSGKFSASFTAKDAQKLWMTLAEDLRKIPNGAIWQDLYGKTKTKHNQINKYTKGTGGGPSLSSAEQLTSIEQQVLETIQQQLVAIEFEDIQYLDENVLHLNT
ncbi:hypothetical protein X777_14529, partial [Ooceraea biroi]